MSPLAASGATRSGRRTSDGSAESGSQISLHLCMRWLGVLLGRLVHRGRVARPAAVVAVGVRDAAELLQLVGLHVATHFRVGAAHTGFGGVLLCLGVRDWRRGRRRERERVGLELRDHRAATSGL